MCRPCKVIIDEAAAAVAQGLPIQVGVRDGVYKILENPEAFDPESLFNTEIQNRMSAVDAWYLDEAAASNSEGPMNARYWRRLRPILRDMADIPSFSALIE